jgi:hypothetical protein
VVDADASEDDVLVYLGKRDKGAWIKLRKQGKYDMADNLWLVKSLKALASRTAEAVIENLPVEAGQTATTDRTLKYWLVKFFGNLVDLHTEKIRRAVTLTSSLLGDDVRGDDMIWKNSVDMDSDERTMRFGCSTSSSKLFKIPSSASALGRSPSTSGAIT